MPTARERQGDFSQTLVGGKLVSILDPISRSPFPGNIVPASRIDSNGQALLSVLPLPNVTDTSISKGVYNYVTQFVSQAPIQLDLLKLDFIVNSSDTLSVTLN